MSHALGLAKTPKGESSHWTRRFIFGMAKKRRHVPGASSLRTSQDAAADLEKPLYNLETYYDQLSADVVEIPATLDDALLLHSLVALVVQNALLVVQGVTIAHMALLGASTLWILRKNIVTVFLPQVALQVKRIAVLVLVLAGFGIVYKKMELALKTTQLVHFAIICLLDVASIYVDKGAKGPLCRTAIVVSAIEHALLVAGFLNCPLHTKGVIIDTTAFVLTTMTAFVHAVVILSAKYMVLHCFNLDTNGSFKSTKQRGAKLLESLWQDIDRFEPEQLLAGSVEASKKKKVKSKAPANFSKTDSTSVDLTLHTQQPILNEPRVQLAILILVQILLLLSQFLFSAFVLNAWEMMSVLVISSSRLLWTLGQIRQKMLSRRTIRPTDSKSRP